MKRLGYLFVATVLTISGVAVAPSAAADCTSFGDDSFCSFGSGGDDDSLPYAPYPCGYDYYCNDSYNWFIT